MARTPATALQAFARIGPTRPSAAGTLADTQLENAASDTPENDFKGVHKTGSNPLFGDRRRVGWGEPARTLFEPAEPMAEIELVRNFVIHDGLLDDMPKAYKVVKEGVAVEKYVLMPDRTGGRFDRFKNRTLFYSREDRINLRLPALVRDFQHRLRETLSLALARLQVDSAKGD